MTFVVTRHTAKIGLIKKKRQEKGGGEGRGVLLIEQWRKGEKET